MYIIDKNKLRTLMVSKGMTTQQLADFLDIAIQNVYKLLDGRTQTPRIDRVIDICDKFGIDNPRDILIKWNLKRNQNDSN